MMRKIAIAALIALSVGPALAQTPPAGTPTRIRGTVDKLDGQNLMVKSRDGQTLTIELAANVAVITLVNKSVADIKAGDYVASTGVKGTDGKVDQAPVLHVTFKGTESEYTVGPDVPVLADGPGDISLLKPGVAVFVIALKHEDGKLTSGRLYAEKDGV